MLPRAEGISRAEPLASWNSRSQARIHTRKRLVLAHCDEIHRSRQSGLDRNDDRLNVLLNPAFPKREGTNPHGEKDANGKMFPEKVHLRPKRRV